MAHRHRKRTVVWIALLLIIPVWGPVSGQQFAPPPVAREKLEAAYESKRLALVIGINEFQDPKWRRLDFAVSDAREVAAKLADPRIGYFDEVIALTDPGAATREGIVEALGRLANKNMSPEDVVLVYISTHGTLAKDEHNNLRQYLVACDTDFDDIAGTALDLDELRTAFSQLVSRRKVLIMAACHSGQGKSELPPDIERELEHLKSGFFVKPLETASEATVIIGASDWGETALEDPGLKHDIYTYFFLQGLDPAAGDLNLDGAVSLSEAHDYAKRETYYFTKGKQRAFARSDILGSDPIILAGKISRSGMPVVFTSSGLFDDAELRLNGRPKGQLPDGFTTEPGWNRIEAVSSIGGDELYEGFVYVRDGERLDLDRLVEDRTGPNLGVVTSYRMMASEDLSSKVIPGLPMYGMAYRLNAFPTVNTALMFEAAYGRTQWETDLESGHQADVSVEAYEANAAFLFRHEGQATEVFAGPLVGAFSMNKNIEVPEKSERRESSTIYPGLIAGIRFEAARDLDFEVSNRLSYHWFTVDDQTRGTGVNEISLGIYFNPVGIARSLRQKQSAQ